MSRSDKQLPLNPQEHTTQNELFMEISMDLQLTAHFSCLKEFFLPTIDYVGLVAALAVLKLGKNRL
ncbi:hypothetical protein Tco_0038148, partial [Tanacetum coccineum]